MRYIRLKSDPLKILASGNVGPGGLGQFDPDVYEEVEGNLPEGYEDYRPPGLHDRLKNILLTLSDDVQAQLAPLAAGVDLALKNQKPNVAKITIQNATIPPELESVRQAMLEEFTSGNT